MRRRVHVFLALGLLLAAVSLNASQAKAAEQEVTQAVDQPWIFGAFFETGAMYYLESESWGDVGPAFGLVAGRRINSFLAFTFDAWLWNPGQVSTHAFIGGALQARIWQVWLKAGLGVGDTDHDDGDGSLIGGTGPSGFLAAGIDILRFWRLHLEIHGRVSFAQFEWSRNPSVAYGLMGGLGLALEY